MHAVRELNSFAIREVKKTFYQTCRSECLSDRDLLVLILGPLVRKELLSTLVDRLLENGLSSLVSLSEIELSMKFGLSEAQSFHLMAVLELAKRLAFRPDNNPKMIRSPKDIYDMFGELQFQEKEHFVVLFLNAKNKVIGRETLSIGSLDSTIVHPREVYKSAIRRNASSIIALHNHPSGDPTPSSPDIEVTKRLIETGELVGITFLDHIVIGSGKYSSLKEMGHI